MGLCSAGGTSMGCTKSTSSKIHFFRKERMAGQEKPQGVLLVHALESYSYIKRMPTRYEGGNRLTTCIERVPCFDSVVGDISGVSTYAYTMWSFTPFSPRQPRCQWSGGLHLEAPNRPIWCATRALLKEISLTDNIASRSEERLNLQDYEELACNMDTATTDASIYRKSFIKTEVEHIHQSRCHRLHTHKPCIHL
jgi:hypothetical protein